MNLYDIYLAQKPGTVYDLYTKLIADWLNNVPEPQLLLTADNESITTTDGEPLKTRR